MQIKIIPVSGESVPRFPGSPQRGRPANALLQKDVLLTLLIKKIRRNIFCTKSDVKKEMRRTVSAMVLEVLHVFSYMRSSGVIRSLLPPPAFFLKVADVVLRVEHTNTHGQHKAKGAEERRLGYK